MVRSMTGFGSGAVSEGGWRVEVTIRTWNHRFLSVRTRSLSDRPLLQARIEERVKETFRRGEIGVWIDLQPDRTASDGRLFDHERARAAYAELDALARDLALSSSPSLEALIRAGALQPFEETDSDVWPTVSLALDKAFEQTLSSREQEGATLAQDLNRLLAALSDQVEAINDRLPTITSALRDRLASRVAELDVSVDADRLEAEIALLAERHDVQEELVRLRGHVKRARGLLVSTDPIGKELDFISQELLREVNTIGSKARDSEISGLVIDMKLSVEQFREQVQNVE